MEDEDFFDIVGSENYENSRAAFIGNIKKCKKTDFTFDEDSGVIVFTKACPNLFVKKAEYYTEIFCEVCNVSTEIDIVKTTALNKDKLSTELDELDEFYSLLGTEVIDFSLNDEEPYPCEEDTDKIEKPPQSFF